MQKYATTILSAVIAVSIGCSKSAEKPPENTGCEVITDCPTKNACINKVCVPLCSAASDCTGGQVCEDAICQAPACGSDAQCSGGQACLNGKCTSGASAADVKSCEVTPNPAVVQAGATTQLSVVGKDAAGNTLHFNTFTWAATGGGATVDQTGAISGSGAGTATVTATAGATSCTATVKAYAAPASSDIRVTVINMHTKEPVVGATVVLDNGPQATGADGTATFSQVNVGPHDVHVFAQGYAYTSFIQTTSRNALIPLSPFVDEARRSGFTGHMCESKDADPTCDDASQFAPLSLPGEGVHLAFFGSGIPNSLLDLSVSTLIGPTHEVSLALTGGTPTKVNLPYGLVLGLTSNFFGTNNYRVYADGGARSLWGIGGNLKVADVISVLNPILQGGSATPDIGALLPQLLPFFSKLQAGAVVGVHAPADVASGATPTFTKQTIPLNTPLRLRAVPVSPDLPKLDDSYVDGVISVVGAMDYPLGFIPLGLTAGLSAKDAGGHNTAKVVDPTCDATSGSCATNRLPMRFAPLNNGTEGSKIGVALLALNFGGLSPGSTQRVAVSGQIKTVDKIDYAAPPSNGPDVTYPAFLQLPKTADVTVSRPTRTLAIAADADSHVQIYRFEIENNARLNWNVWIAPGTRSVTLPDPNQFGTFTDPFLDAVSPDDGKTAGPTSRLLGLQFTNAASTAASVETFGSLTLDQIGTNLQAFTALQVPVSQ